MRWSPVADPGRIDGSPSLRGALVAIIATVLVGGAAVPVVALSIPRSHPSARGPIRGRVREIRSVPTVDLSILRPRDLVSVGGRLVVRGARRTVTVSTAGELSSSVARPVPPGSTLLTIGGRVASIEDGALRGISGRLWSGVDRIEHALRQVGARGIRAAAVDDADGLTFVLTGDGGSILVVPSDGGAVARFRSEGYGEPSFDALAYHDGTLWLATEHRLIGLDDLGQVRRSYRMGSVGLRNLRAMAFAPSPDSTDPAGIDHLFLADAGDGSTSGRIAEATLAEPVVAAAAPLVTANLVQVIQTSRWVPASPDPSGIVWTGPTRDRLVVADSEVDEVTGAGQNTTNLWQVGRLAPNAVFSTTNSYAYSKETTGLGYDRTSKTLFVSDDDRDRIAVNRLGSDETWSADDPAVTFVPTGVLGSSDTEDPEWLNGHLFFIDGVNVELYDIDPVDAVVGNGNDVATHCDIAQHGGLDLEGLSSDPSRGTLLVGDRRLRKIFEVTPTCALIRTIDASKISGMSNLSGLAYAPASDGSGRMDYWIVDRAVDNGPDPSENDGKIFEISAHGSDAFPTVSLTAPSGGATVSGEVVLSASAGDDLGVTRVEFTVDGVLVGADTRTGTSGTWSSSWNSASSIDGTHQIRARAIDTIGQVTTSAAVAVSVDNVDEAPTVSVSSPAPGSAVTGSSVTFTAAATDDRGVRGVEFLVDGASIGSDTDPAGGWSRTWDLSSVSEGGHQVVAIATDDAEPPHSTTSAAVAFIVDNSAPSVSVTSPLPDSTVGGTVPLAADAVDLGSGVSRVEFRIGGVLVGTDSDPAGGWSIQWFSTAADNGARQVTATATDAGGLSTTSSPVSFTVDNPVVGTIRIRVASSSDDAEERVSTKGVRTDSSDLELVTDKDLVQLVGMRFTNVQLPAGATIVSSYVQFQAKSTGSASTSLRVSGEAADNAPTFTAKTGNISARKATSASVDWPNVASWTSVGAAGSAQRTPDITSILNEIVQRPGWVNGNAVVLMISGSGLRRAEAFDGVTTGAPQLVIEYGISPG